MGKDKYKNLEQDLKIRNYSPKTIKSYLYYNQNFIDFIKKSPREVNEQDVRAYLERLSETKSSQTVALALNALKYYYKIFYRRRFLNNIKHPKKESKLPVVLSKEEVKRLLGCIKNVKHKLMLSLMYASGLRISEVLNLKVRDFDFDNGVLFVRAGKGKKDRQTLLPEIIKDVLFQYIEGKDGTELVFASNRGGKLTARSLQKVFHSAVREAGIKKDATCHSLRHSFATHLLENRVDVRYIQELLGHKNIETTQLYTKVASDKLREIGSPLDGLV